MLIARSISKGYRESLRSKSTPGSFVHFGAYFHDRQSRRSFFQLKNTLLRVGRGEPRFIRRLDHFEEYNYDNLSVSLFIPLL